MTNPRTVICVHEHNTEVAHGVFDTMYGSGFTKLWLLTPDEVNETDIQAAELFIFVNKADKEYVEKRVFLGWFNLENAKGMKRNCIVLDIAKWKTVEQLHDNIKDAFAAAGHPIADPA